MPEPATSCAECVGLSARWGPAAAGEPQLTVAVSSPQGSFPGADGRNHGPWEWRTPHESELGLHCYERSVRLLRCSVMVTATGVTEASPPARAARPAPPQSHLPSRRSDPCAMARARVYRAPGCSARSLAR